jgi:molybdate transport system ATP-binding protein
VLEARVRKQLRDFPLDLSITVKPGEILVLMGENGAGKSMTLNMVSGIISPDSGFIRLNGTVFCDPEGGIQVPVEDRRIGYVFQNPAVFPHMTVRENVAFGLRARNMPKSDMAGQVDRWLGTMNISDLAGVKAGSLSGGQRQRVALARALAPEPVLLMLDEPFSALDTWSIHELKTFLRPYVADNRIPCILVMHRVRDVKDVADRVCILDRGARVWEGRPEDIPEGSWRSLGISNIIRGTASKAGDISRITTGTGQVLYAASGISGEVVATVPAEDVIVSQEPFTSSARNCLPGTVSEVNPSGSTARVILDVGFPLTALLTPGSCHDLQLEKGKKVYATFKASAVHVTPVTQQ